MHEVLMRIDEIIKKIEVNRRGLDSSYSVEYIDLSIYNEIVYEIDEIIIETLGKDNDVYYNFMSVVKSKAYGSDKCIMLLGVLNGLKSLIKIKLDKNKRYQIFVSSTFRDLELYRKKVADEIIFRGHIPAGMEDFTACGEDLETYIKGVIDNSDYYLLILGQRWGTALPNDEATSYTMMEYNYAKSKGMRIIPMIYNGTIRLEGNDLDINGDRFKQFTQEVGNLTPQYFKDENELVRKVLKSLDNEIKKHPQKGWVRL